MKRIAIIGAGQSGLQLALGLLDAGFDVTLYSGRSADEIREGRVMSSHKGEKRQEGLWIFYTFPTHCVY